MAAAAAAAAKKAMKFTLSIFFPKFNSSKCKTAAKLAVARIKLLRNKRQVVVKQMRRDIAALLQSGQDETARVRVEHVIREQNILAANEFIELFCELIVSRLSIIAKRRECPADLKEGISSLIFAAPRCSEIPELVALRDIFEKKYGKDFVGAATNLRPSCGVNRLLIDKLSVRTPAGELKLKVMKEIAKEYQVEWDTTESEMELLKPPEELIRGPSAFLSASSLPVDPMPKQSVDAKERETRHSSGGEKKAMNFEDATSAAAAAAESALRAVAAAEVAAYMANKNLNHISQQAYAFPKGANAARVHNDFDSISDHPTGNITQELSETTRQSKEKSNKSTGQGLSPTNMDSQWFYRRHNSNYPTGDGVKFDESDCDEQPETLEKSTVTDDRKTYRRHSYNVHPVSVQYDDSDCDEEIEAEEPPKTGINAPPNRPAPLVPSNKLPHHSVHPKLPDYDALAARFEALKNHKSQR